jgi:hypothetical protein
MVGRAISSIRDDERYRLAVCLIVWDREAEKYPVTVPCQRVPVPLELLYQICAKRGKPVRDR